MSSQEKIEFADLLSLLSRSPTQEFPFDKTHGKWYVFLNSTRGIQTSKNIDHRWLRLCGAKVVGKGQVAFDSAVEPIFLRSTREGEAPDCVVHRSHPHASSTGCVLNKDGYVWINVNRNMEPNIREYERTTTLDDSPHFCVEEGPEFLKAFIYWLTDQGGRFDLQTSGI
jgi:hypothetical protein